MTESMHEHRCATGMKERLTPIGIWSSQSHIYEHNSN